MKEAVNLIDILKNKYSLIEANDKVELNQSSYSDWSKADEPYTLIRDNEFEFANHTSLELCPWVKMSFEESINPYFIIIENRNNDKYIDLASELIVQSSVDGEIYRDIHRGVCYFSSLPNGYPLILPLLGKEKLRHLKISINSDTPTYLHLRRLTVLKSKDLPDCDGAFFLANRSDGLGERLKAILNAIFFSEKLGLSYRIAWPLRGGMNVNQYHDITEANEIFDEKYIINYFINEKDLENRRIIDLGKKGPVSTNDIRKIDEKKYEFIKVQQSDVRKYISDIKRGKNDYRDCFKKIKFSKSIVNVIDYVNSIAIKKDTYAIHIRGGDIVYGEYRKSQLFYQKLIPLATCIYLHNRLKSQKKNVIVFYQDKNLRSYLKSFGMCLSDDYIIENWSPLQKTFFEMYLMSKCSEIICGTSGFASVASRISGTKIRKAESYLNEFEILESLHQRIDDCEMDDLQKAFTINNYLVKVEKQLDIYDTIDFLELAISLDPDNELYKVKLVLARLSADQITEADVELSTLLENKKNIVGVENMFIKSFYPVDLKYYYRNFKDLNLSRFKNLQRLRNIITLYLS